MQDNQSPVCSQDWFKLRPIPAVTHWYAMFSTLAFLTHIKNVKMSLGHPKLVIWFLFF